MGPQTQAIMHHASFRSELINVAIRKNTLDRVINLSLLKELARKNEKINFEYAYKNHLSNEKYIRYIKKEFFTFKGVNVAPYERLFTINTSDQEAGKLIEVISNIANKYYLQNSSPAPYVYVSGLSEKVMTSLKISLADKEKFFSDGTHFNGDRFRLESLTKDYHKQPHNRVTFRMICDSTLDNTLDAVSFDEVYDFQCGSPESSLPEMGVTKKFYVDQLSDILKVIT